MPPTIGKLSPRYLIGSQVEGEWPWPVLRLERVSTGSPWRVGWLVAYCGEPCDTYANGSILVLADQVVGRVDELSQGERASEGERVGVALARQLDEEGGATRPDGAVRHAPVPLRPSDSANGVVRSPSSSESQKSEKLDPAERKSLLNWVLESSEGGVLRRDLDALKRDRAVAVWSSRLRLGSNPTREEFLELSARCLEQPDGPGIHQRLKDAGDLSESAQE